MFFLLSHPRHLSKSWQKGPSKILNVRQCHISKDVWPELLKEDGVRFCFSQSEYMLQNFGSYSTYCPLDIWLISGQSRQTSTGGQNDWKRKTKKTLNYINTTSVNEKLVQETINEPFLYFMENKKKNTCMKNIIQTEFSPVDLSMFTTIWYDQFTRNLKAICSINHSHYLPVEFWKILLQVAVFAQETRFCQKWDFDCSHYSLSFPPWKLQGPPPHAKTILLNFSSVQNIKWLKDERCNTFFSGF